MKNNLLRLRYYLEIVAVPAFIFLVIHLSGHGLLSLMGDDHDHAHHSENTEKSAEHGFDIHEILESVLTVEILSGVLLLILFVWLWNRPQLKKWVPCSHGCCKNEKPLPHILAIVALCLHFFPEAGIRHELLHHALEGEIESTFGFIGFLAHFMIDIIIAIVLSSYWKTRRGFFTSLIVITVIWFFAFFMAEKLMGHIPPTSEGILYLASGFLLSMFIHKPHKQVLICH